MFQKILHKKNAAFTLVEVLVVVLIIAIIATLAMTSYTGIRRKGRDAKRVSSINTLQSALLLYNNDHGVYPDAITAGMALKNSTNTKTYLDEVPFNPQPRTDHGCPDTEFKYFVSADKKSYSITGCIGEDNNPNKSKLIIGQTEGIFNCGDKITDRDGYSYSTVSIGTQCWMAENLKTKTNPDGSCINKSQNMAPPSCTWYNSGTEYGSYSINDGRDCVSISGTQGTEADCQAGRTLYNLQHALRCFKSSGTVNCGTQVDPDTMCCNNQWISNINVQGICPNGWHVPTENEFTTLEQYLANPSASCTANRVTFECDGAGTKLKSGGSSGFNALLMGRRQSTSDIPASTLPPPFPGNTKFIYYTITDWFISANMSNNTSYFRYLTNTENRVSRLSQNIDLRGWSLRCIKN